MEDQTQIIQKQGEQIKKLRKDVKHLVEENRSLAAIFRMEFETLRDFLKSKVDMLHEEIDGLAEDIDYIKTKSSSANRHLKSLAKGLKLPTEQFMSDTDNNFFRRSTRHSRGRKPRKPEVYGSLNDLPKSTFGSQQDRWSMYQSRHPSTNYPDSSSSSSDSGEDTTKQVDSSIETQVINKSNPLISMHHQHNKDRNTVLPVTNVSSTVTNSTGGASSVSPSTSRSNNIQREEARNLDTKLTSASTPTGNTNISTAAGNTNIRTPTGNTNIRTPTGNTNTMGNSNIRTPVNTDTKVAYTTPVAQNLKQPENIQPFSQTQKSLNLDNVEDYMTSCCIDITREARQAIEESFKCDEYQSKPEGIYTVLLVDASRSMEGEPGTRMKNYLVDFIDEVENSAAYNNLEENVAVVTFGATTCIQQRFTNDYGNIREVVENLRFEGRSPLLTGLAMCIKYLRDSGKVLDITSAIHVIPRIILVTDGFLTDDSSFTGQDHEPNSIQCQTKVLNFISAAKQFGYPIISVGMGEYNKSFLQSFPCAGGLSDPEDVLYLARYYLYETIVGQIIAENDEVGGRGNIPNLVRNATKDSFESRGLGKRDHEEISKLLQVHDIVYDVQSIEFESDIESDGERLEDLGVGVTDQFARLLSVGTRVKRGPNWNFEDQDGNGPGTVVAHKDKGQLVVKWDNGNMNMYFYQHNGISHVMKCDSDRILKPGEDIQVGCCVKRGIDWNVNSEEDGGDGTVGIVIRKHRDKKVSVRWPSQVVDKYSFGHNSKYEVEIVERMNHGVAQLDSGAAGLPSMGGSGGQDETYAWQWQDEGDQWRTLVQDEAEKLEDYSQNKKPGTVLVLHYGSQMRCDPNKMKYRADHGGHQGALRRIMLSKEELDSLHGLELAMLDQ